MLLIGCVICILAKNIRLIAEALACNIFNYKETACQGTMFDERNGSNHVSKDHIKQWAEYFSTTPRFAGLMTTNKVITCCNTVIFCQGFTWGGWGDNFCSKKRSRQFNPP